MDKGLVRYIEPLGDLRLSVNRGDRSEEARLRDAFGVLRRNWLLVLGCAIIVPIVAVIATRHMTPQYRASASIRVDAKQPSLPVLDALQGIASANEVSTEMAELQSRMLMEDVVEALGLRLRVLEPERSVRGEIFATITAGRAADSGVFSLEREPGGRFRIVNVMSRARLGTVGIGEQGALGTARFVLAPTASRYERIELALQPFDGAVTTLQNAVEVLRPTRDANIIAVRYEGADPTLVRDVTNAMATHFIERRQSVRQTETRSTVKFLRAQLERLSYQLAAAEDTLRSFREREQIVDLQEEGRSEVSHVAELQAQRNLTDAERSALARLLSNVRDSAGQQLPGAPSPYRNLVAFPTLLRNQAASELLASLTAAEDRRTELLTRRTPQDPDVQLLTGRVKQLEDQLRLITVTYLQGLTEQVTSYDALLGQSSRQLQRFPVKEIQLARLQRQVKSLDDIYTLLQTRLQEAGVAEAVQDASVRVVDTASVPRVPVRPKPLLNLSLAIVTGLLLGISAAFVREYADHSVHTRNELQAIAGTPVLGLIPHSRRSSQLVSRIVGTAQRFTRMGGRAAQGTGGAAGGRASGSSLAPLPVAKHGDVRVMGEAFQRLATNISFARRDGPIKRLLLTSPLPGDGKTMVAVNMAITLAQRGQRVLLVDADLRRGRINSLFRISREPGLWNVISGSMPLPDARQVINASNGTLHVLTTGALQENPAPALSVDRIRAVLAPVEEAYDMVIVDTPPINVVTDAALLSSSCDGVLIIVRAGVTAVPALALAVEQLRHVHATILGAVLNDIDFARDASYDGTYQYYGNNVRYETESVI